jgi:Ca2+-binding RTX toxin-like protein
MCNKAIQSLWLLPLLAFLNTTPSANAALYNQQVIVILEEDPTIQKAAHFLYEKHDTTSYTIQWNSNSQMFERVRWSEQTQSHAISPAQEPLPIYRDEWLKTYIQVVGHGDINSETATIAGFSAEDLAETLTTGVSKGDVGRIGIVGCTRVGEGESTSSQSPRFLYSFMDKLKQLGRSKTEVSLRSALVSIDPNGRILTGELFLSGNETVPEVSMEWGHKNSPNEWTGTFLQRNLYRIEQTKARATQPGVLESRFFGIIPEDSDIHVSTFTESTTTASASYSISDEKAFQRVDRVSHNTYRNIPAGRAAEVSRVVQFLTGMQNMSDVLIREFNGMNDLLRELLHYGETGPALQRSKVHYRFGDWVLSMDTINFHVSVEGIIVSPRDSSQKTSQVMAILQQWRDLPNQRMPADYASTQPETGSNFFENVRSWINGEHSGISLDMENAYNAQCGTAMFLSESIRSFHNHVTNMMSLDLVYHGYLSKEYFFRSHPMGRPLTWQIKYRVQGREVKRTGLEMLRDTAAKEGRLLDTRTQRAFNSIISRISRISKSWLSHIDIVGLKGSRDVPPQTTPYEYTGLTGQTELLSPIEDIASAEPNSTQYLRDYELGEATDHQLSTEISEPAIESVGAMIEGFSSVEDTSLPLRVSMALANDHTYVSNLIKEQVQLKEQQMSSQYEVVHDSVAVGKDNTLRLRLQGISNPASQALVSININRARLTTKLLLDDLQLKAVEIQRLEKSQDEISRIHQGLALYSVARGLRSSISAFENGNTTQGVVGLAQSLHGIGELSGFNMAVHRAAGKYLGQVLHSQVEAIAATVSTIAGEDASELIRSAGGEVLSTVGDVGSILEDIPLLGTAFGIYNIHEDFQPHSTLGYVDAGLDTALSGLSLLGPKAEPLVVALAMIKMEIDTFYHDIDSELRTLPPNASITQKVGAVFEGIGRSFVDLFEEFTLPGQILGAIDSSHKLNEQYDQGSFSQNDYHSYFNDIKVEESGSSITEDYEPWNGGEITFYLGESGQSTLVLEAVDTNGSLLLENHTVVTGGVQDIVVGIGESQSISFKKQSAKILWFIPLDSRALISDMLEDQVNTLHGTYYGNSGANTFIAVQELPPLGNNSGYNLDDYHYKLYGQGGDDTFYLGSQYSYIEGNEGSDTYFVNTSSVHVDINNYAEDGKTDYLIMYMDYSNLIPRRVGLNLQITTANNLHEIVITNWFHDLSYQHLVFKTGDGVLFKVSATGSSQVDFIPYALSSAMAKQSHILDAREHEWSHVVALVGSKFNDIITGNDLDNQLNGGKGDDMLTGGEGRDTYTIDFQEGVDTIDNCAVDGKTDVLIIAAGVDDIVASSRPSTHDLYLSRSGSTGNLQTGAVVKNWFLSDHYRHMILVLEDGTAMSIPSTKDSSVKLQPIIMDMSEDQVEEPTEQEEENYDAYYYFDFFDSFNSPEHPSNPQEKQMDLSSDPLLSEVVAVMGSAHDDAITGNHKDNYISGGRGHDTMEGKEGKDVYIIREGDGSKTIKNFAEDGEIDTLLFGASFDDIQVSSFFGDLVLTAHRTVQEKRMEVTVDKWFYGGVAYQHLVVRSADGIIFQLPIAEHSLTKTARFIDSSNLSTNTNINLAGKWSQVQRVLGSQGNDTVVGNSLSNYFDPGSGRCHLIGNNGSDTYVIRNNGKENVINNHAKDNLPDTVFFKVPFFSIDAKVRGNDIELTSEGNVSARLKNYMSEPKNRHLTVVTEDGYSFVLPSTSSFKPVPIIINRAQATTGQHINLTASSTLSEVRTVYGSTHYENSIAGNQRNNMLIGGSEADFLEGLNGDDVLKGGAGDDTLLGGPGADILVGGDGNDRIEGGEGDDVISPGLGTNRVDGGDGTDTVIYSGEVSSGNGIHLDLQRNVCIHANSAEDVLLGIENAYGTEYNDVMQGDDEDNMLVGQGGDDHLLPGSGYDVLDGGNGRDTYNLASANGTVAIINYATDRAMDRVIMSYTDVSNLRYQKAGNDLVLRVINTQHPVFYDVTKPTVVFRGWYFNAQHQHAYIDAADGRIGNTLLKRHSRDAAARAA